MAKLVLVGNTPIAYCVPEEGIFRIGRDMGSDVCILDRQISRKHCCIERTERGYELTDTSKIGTYIHRQNPDGEERETIEVKQRFETLKEEDIVQIGTAFFTFLGRSAVPESS